MELVSIEIDEEIAASLEGLGPRFILAPRRP